MHGMDVGSGKREHNSLVKGNISDHRNMFQESKGHRQLPVVNHDDPSNK